MSPLVTQRIAQTPRWAKNELWRRARAVPSLDLRFADNKSLVDATSGAQLVTFTRASSGTYVDSQGVIRTATTNLLLRSEEFSDATNWGAVGSASVAANADISPTGTLTADKLTLGSNGYIRQFRASNVVNGTYTISAWVRKSASGGATAIRITSNNTVAWNTGYSQKFTLTSEWQRISATGVLTSSGTDAYVIFGAKDAANNNDADCVGDVLIWGAQLEQSSTVGEYVPTTSSINSAPRFDHNPTTGESLGLLVEESRANLLVRSEEFDNASWANFQSSETANAAIAPNGLLTADKLIEDSNTGAHLVQQVVTTTAAAHTFSVYLKAGERSWAYLSNSTVTNANAYFDLASGSLGTVGASTTASIAPVGDGWYRCSIVMTATAAANTFRIQTANANNGLSYTGDGTSGIYLWGAQLEAGAFPTSYIKTEASAATRAADVASITGTNFSSWYRQDEGTVFAEAILSATGTNGIAGFADGTNNERWRIGHQGTNAASFVMVDGGVVQINTLTQVASWPVGASGRIAGAVQLNNSAVSNNGQAPVEDLACTMPTVTEMTIGTAQATAYANARIRRLTYWPQRLGNEVLQRITQ